MTSRLLYEGLLIELNKVNAPNILLEDFNYFANKAINQYINKRYNIYDINLLTTDDLRVLKATAILKPKRLKTYDALSLVNNKMATYYVDLPSDYLHLLNCICIYNVNKTYKCYNKGETWRAAATRLTADAYSQVLDNFWLRPTYKRPYYYIHNINQLTSDGSTNTNIPTNPYRYVDGTLIGTDSNFTKASDYHGDYDIINTGEEEDDGSDPKTTPEETKLVVLDIVINGSSTIEYGEPVPEITYSCDNPDILGNYKPTLSYNIPNRPDVKTYKINIDRGDIPSNIEVKYKNNILSKSLQVVEKEITAELISNIDYYRGDPFPTITLDNINLCDLLYGLTKYDVFGNTVPSVTFSEENNGYYDITIRRTKFKNYLLKEGVIGSLRIKERKPALEKLKITVLNIEEEYGELVDSNISYELTNGTLELNDKFSPIFYAKNNSGTLFKISNKLDASTYEIVLSDNVRNTDYILENENGNPPTITITPARLIIGLKSVSMETDDSLIINSSKGEYKIVDGDTEEEKIIGDIFTYSGIKNIDSFNSIINKNPGIKLDGNSVSTTPITFQLSGNHILSIDTTGVLNSENYTIDTEHGQLATLTVSNDTTVTIGGEPVSKVYIYIEDILCKMGETPTLYYRDHTNYNTRIESGNPIVLAVYNGNTKVTNISSLTPGNYLIKLDEDVSGQEYVEVKENGILEIQKASLTIGLNPSNVELPLTTFKNSDDSYKSILDVITLTYLLGLSGTTITQSPNIGISTDGLKVYNIVKTSYEPGLLGTYKVYLGGLSSSLYNIQYLPVTILVVSDVRFKFPDDGFEYTKVAVPKDFIFYGPAITLKTEIFDVYCFVVKGRLQNTIVSNTNSVDFITFLSGKDGKVLAKKNKNTTENFIDELGDPIFIPYSYPYIDSIVIENEKRSDDLEESNEGWINGNVYRIKQNNKYIYVTYPEDRINVVGKKVYEATSYDGEIIEHKPSIDENNLFVEDSISVENNGENQTVTYYHHYNYDEFNYRFEYLDYEKYSTSSEDEITEYIIDEYNNNKKYTVIPCKLTETLKIPENILANYYYFKRGKDGETLRINENGKTVSDIIAENSAFIKSIEISKILNEGEVNENVTINSDKKFTYSPFIWLWNASKGNFTAVSFSEWIMEINGKTYNCKVGETIPFINELNYVKDKNSGALPYYTLNGKTIDNWTVKGVYNKVTYSTLKFIENWEIEGSITHGYGNYTFGNFFPVKIYIPGFPSFINNLGTNDEKDKYNKLSDYSKVFEIYRRIKEVSNTDELSTYRDSIVFNRTNPTMNESWYIVEFGYWKRDGVTWEILNGGITTETELVEIEDAFLGDVTITRTVEKVSPLEFVKIENFPPSNYRCKLPGAEVFYYDSSIKLSPFEVDNYCTSEQLKGLQESISAHLGPSDYGWDWKWNDNSTGNWCNRCGYLNRLAKEDKIKKGTNKEDCYSPADNLSLDCDCVDAIIPNPTQLSTSVEPPSDSNSDSNNKISIVQGITPPNFILTGDKAISNVERGQGIRYGNVSRVRLEIRYGTDSSIFSLDYEQGRPGGLIYIDYLKVPQHIRLTQYELDLTEDTSLVLEYPDYVCQEIINELTHIVMENISDPKLQTHPVVSLSIANPAQTLAPEAAGQSAQ